MKFLYRRVRRSRRPEVAKPTAAEVVAAGKLPTPDARARALLLLHLNPVQRRTFTRSNYIELVGSRGGWYCLHANPLVYRLDGRGQHVASFCSHVPYWRYAHDDGKGEWTREMPREDHVLSHLLLLLHDEHRFLEIAPMHFVGGDHRLSHRRR